MTDDQIKKAEIRTIKIDRAKNATMDKLLNGQIIRPREIMDTFYCEILKNGLCVKLKEN